MLGGVQAKALLRQMFDAAVASAQPAVCLPRYLPQPPQGNTVLIGAGKASAEMARVFEHSWHEPLSGIVVTRYGHAVACPRVRVLEAAHPVPDQAGVLATQQIIQSVSRLSADDLVVMLISGGGSALLTCPPGNLSLADKVAVNRALLESGAPISAINCVRKHLSAVKGGRLALAAAPASVLTLAISDVPGDDPAAIGSGPTVPDPGTRRQALDIIRDYHLRVPESVIQHLRSSVAESAKPDDPRFDRCTTQIIAAPITALQQAAKTGADAGYRVELLGDAIEGEAREVARQHAELVRSTTPGTILLSGGELTVARPGNGKGGPNTEYALALAAYLRGKKQVYAIACDTDGIDGSEDNAGAWIGPDSLQRAEALGMDATRYLEQHDAYTYFKSLDDLVMSGPTRTNVNDFRAILIGCD